MVVPILQTCLYDSLAVLVEELSLSHERRERTCQSYQEKEHQCSERLAKTTAEQQQVSSFIGSNSNAFPCWASGWVRADGQVRVACRLLHVAC